MKISYRSKYFEDQRDPAVKNEWVTGKHMIRSEDNNMKC